jgi:hypothetical protein
MDVILSSLNPWGGLQKGIVSALTVFTVSSFVSVFISVGHFLCCLCAMVIYVL